MCLKAGIELHWCTCLNWESAMESDEQLNVTYMLAKAIVQTLNSFTKPERKLCARLRLVCNFLILLHAFNLFFSSDAYC